MITQPHPSWVTPHSNGTTARVNEVNTYTIRQALGYGDHCSQNKEPHLNRTDLWHIKPKSRSRCHGWTNREARQTCIQVQVQKTPSCKVCYTNTSCLPYESRVWSLFLAFYVQIRTVHPSLCEVLIIGFGLLNLAPGLNLPFPAVCFLVTLLLSHSVSYSQCFLWFSLPLFMA